jgi:hypothetical protein
VAKKILLNELLIQVKTGSDVMIRITECTRVRRNESSICSNAVRFKKNITDKYLNNYRAGLHPENSVAIICLTNYAGLLIKKYKTKTKNKTKIKEKKILRITVCLLRVASFLKAAFISWLFLEGWIIWCQDNFDFAKRQISVQ